VGVIRHGIMSQWKSAAPGNFLIDDFEKLRPPSPIDQGLTGMSGPSKMVVELVKHVGHDVSSKV
jgi:hypothetical protein